MTNNAISFSLRQLVIERAQGHCEYCLIHQDFSIYSHEIYHIIAVKHGVKLYQKIWLYLVYLVIVIKDLILLLLIPIMGKLFAYLIPGYNFGMNI
ncbi:hypothetical protein [Sphaerospermopsis aphanizomenoides]|uniref:hypothetical protein n=1 Tax=Sphaerospermopsis aphanizomenoides TaxID=459663 RepID=UPI001F239C72|nr:hypothetical protein [Sphaerospermopsis aphanizomenoides]